jgi:GT2 family glycosyltransferase
MTYLDYNEPAEVDQPMGTFLLMRREVYDAVGGMDEAFPLFFNDVDWCYRAKQKGYKIYYTPDAEIVHYGGSGTSQAPKPAVIRESHRSMIRFYEKHYRSAYPAPILAAIKLAILTGEVARIGARFRGWRLPRRKAPIPNVKQLAPPPSDGAP